MNKLIKNIQLDCLKEKHNQMNMINLQEKNGLDRNIKRKNGIQTLIAVHKKNLLVKQQLHLYHINNPLNLYNNHNKLLVNNNHNNLQIHFKIYLDNHNNKLAINNQYSNQYNKILQIKNINQLNNQKHNNK